MKKLFSSQLDKFMTQTDKSEKELQQFIWNNQKKLFPQYTFITQEFTLKGAVHASGNSGRIDILAYNPDTKRFVFFELKKNFDKNIGHQATNYRFYIKKNFLNVYVDALQKYKLTLPDKKEVDDKEVEIILIAKEFTPLLIDQAEEENLITLIEYNWFENDLLLLDYVHAPDIELDVSDPGEPIKEPYEGKDWHYIVNVIQKTKIRKALQAIPFPPATTEQYDQLKALVEQVPDIHKRTALQKKLDDIKQ